MLVTNEKYNKRNWQLLRIIVNEKLIAINGKSKCRKRKLIFR